MQIEVTEFAVPATPSRAVSGRYNSDTTRQNPHGLAKLDRIDGLNCVHVARRMVACSPLTDWF